MYGVKILTKVSQRNYIFCGTLSQKPMLQSGYLPEDKHLPNLTEGTFKQKDSSKKTSSFSGLSKKLYLSFADFTKTLAIKVKL